MKFMSKTKINRFLFAKRMSADRPAEMCMKPSMLFIPFRPFLSRQRMEM